MKSGEGTMRFPDPDKAWTYQKRSSRRLERLTITQKARVLSHLMRDYHILKDAGERLAEEQAQYKK